MDARDERPLRRRRAAAAALAGLLAGSAVAAGLFSCGGGFEEREEFRPHATEAEVDEWQAEWERRAAPHIRIPDPPGEGSVVTARYWISKTVYGMEVRRRGGRVVVGIGGVDSQTMGGGWTAFAEGAITGDPSSFADAEARIHWSCLGIRYRSESDGVAKLSFSPDGTRVTAVYSAYETWKDAEPFAFMKGYGEIVRGPRPPYSTYRGQIPYLPAMKRLPAKALVRVRGVVRTSEGAKVPDALVQLKGKPGTAVHSDEAGRFELSFEGREAPWAQCICAGAIGHRNGETVLFTGDSTDDVVVEVEPIDMRDHADYAWVHPAPDRDADDAMSCGTCHSWQYTEWLGSRHARMADHGHVAWERERMRRKAPAAPDDCAACHQPAYAAQSGRGDYVPRGVLASNHCDFCHKVRHVEDANAPGVFGSLVLARPDPKALDRPGAIHRVFGPSADSTFAYMGASYDPMLSTSWLCAGCHQGGGVAKTPKVSTFDEWKAWTVDHRDDSFRECQGCHMKAGTTETVDGKKVDLFAWEGLHRSPSAVHGHSFPGASATLGKEALDVLVSKRWDEPARAWIVTVTVTNRGAAHKVPTGTWTKHVAVGVWAKQGDRWLAAGAGDRAVLDEGLSAEPVSLVG